METAKLAYWSTFWIPVIFIVLRILIQRVIDGPPWELKHSFIGVDLSVFSLAASLGNVIELFSVPGANSASEGLHTLQLLALIFLTLFYQVTVHQQYERAGSSTPGKTWMLCVVSNLIGIALIGAFVWLKTKEVI